VLLTKYPGPATYEESQFIELIVWEIQVYTMADTLVWPLLRWYIMVEAYVRTSAHITNQEAERKK
jgi:hypothetical protein